MSSAGMITKGTIGPLRPPKPLDAESKTNNSTPPAAAKTTPNTRKQPAPPVDSGTVGNCLISSGNFGCWRTAAKTAARSAARPPDAAGGVDESAACSVPQWRQRASVSSSAAPQLVQVPIVLL